MLKNRHSIIKNFTILVKIYAFSTEMVFHWAFREFIPYAIFCVSHINFGDTLNFIILTRARPVLIDYIIGSRIERKFMVFHKWNSTCVLESASSAFGMYCVVHKSKFFYYTRLNPLDHDYTTTNYTKKIATRPKHKTLSIFEVW